MPTGAAANKPSRMAASSSATRPASSHTGSYLARVLYRYDDATAKSGRRPPLAQPTRSTAGSGRAEADRKTGEPAHFLLKRHTAGRFVGCATGPRIHPRRTAVLLA